MKSKVVYYEVHFYDQEHDCYYSRRVGDWQEVKKMMDHPDYISFVTKETTSSYVV